MVLCFGQQYYCFPSIFLGCVFDEVDKKQFNFRCNKVWHSVKTDRKQHLIYRRKYLFYYDKSHMDRRMELGFLVICLLQ